MKRFLSTAVPGILLLLAGCAPLRAGEGSTAGITVETLPTSVATVTRAAVYGEDGRLVVAGTLRRLHEVKFPGHVDITLCGTEGVLARRSVPLAGLASKRKGAMNLPFAATFEPPPTSVAKVVLRYHAPPFAGEDIPPCTRGAETAKAG